MLNEITGTLIAPDALRLVVKTDVTKTCGCDMCAPGYGETT